MASIQVDGSRSGDETVTDAPNISSTFTNSPYPSSSSCSVSGRNETSITTATPQSKRKRVARACDVCSKRKIQCDAQYPRCDWCKHHDLDCTFNRITKRSKRKKDDKQANEEVNGNRPAAASDSAEDNELTKSLNKEYISESSACQIGMRRSGVPGTSGHTFGILHFAGCRLGQMSSIRGIPLIYPDGERWVEKVTGEKVFFDRLYGQKGSEGGIPRIFEQSASDGGGSGGTTTWTLTTKTGLPPRWLTEECHRCYSVSVRRLVFPVVDPILFRRTISLAYDEDAFNYAQFQCTTARAAVFAFVSFTAVMIPESLGHLEIDRDRYANEALKLLPYATMSTSIDGVQSLLALTLYLLFSGEADSASMHISNASSAVVRLGGHHYPHPPVEGAEPGGLALSPSPSAMDVRIAKHVRNLFWLTFSVDFMISLHSGLPPAFNIHFCDLTLPPRYEEIYTQQAAHGIFETLPPDVDYDPWFPGDIRLTIIQAKAHMKLYSHHAMFKSDAELIRDIRELDMEVDAWRESVPSLFRPSWVHSQHLPTSRHLSIVILRLIFYHIIALIHRASSRCEAWSNMEPRWDVDALGSSLALSVEASRSSLLYIRSVADTVAESFFSMILIFPMTSFLVLFSNLLLAPLDEQAASDLALLEQVPDTIMRLKFRLQSQREVSHVRRVYDFVSELVRLGKCAVAKARRERERQLLENAMTE